MYDAPAPPAGKTAAVPPAPKPKAAKAKAHAEGISAGHAVEVAPPATKDNGGTGKTYRAEKIGGKALTSGGDGGIIKASGIRVNLQLFANKNIAKMSSVQLEKSIKAWKSKVEEHREKISAPEKFYPDWDSFDERYKLGNIKHWQKEIDNFKTDISRAEEELKKRGDLNG